MELNANTVHLTPLSASKTALLTLTLMETNVLLAMHHAEVAGVLTTTTVSLVTMTCFSLTMSTLADLTVAMASREISRNATMEIQTTEMGATVTAK